MKKITLICFYIFFTWYAFSLPVSFSSVQIDAQVSADIYTKSELTSSSLWYGTIMPGFEVSCSYNYLDVKNRFHKLGFGFKYFESNNFNANSLDLDPGEMRALIFDLHGFYFRYLPISSHLDYITGLSLSGVYNYYGKVITSDESAISELYYIKAGPANGFSLNIRDLFELRSILFINAGIPVSGRIYYPGGFNEEVLPLTVNMKINTEISLSFKRTFFSLSYEWFSEILVLVEGNENSFIPQAVNTESMHSIALKVGIRI